MDVLLQNNKKSWFEFFSSVNQHQSGLVSLNSWWDKVALVGKINSLNVPQSLLANMLETKAEFADLQEVLIDNLLAEQLQQCYSKNQTLAQTLVDIPNRNLFERTADVGFLATDGALINHLKMSSTEETNTLSIKQRLHDYIAKYSVYDDIILFNQQGELLLRSESCATDEEINEPIIQEVLNGSQPYWEICRYSPLYPEKPVSSLFLAPVKDSASGKVLGVLCMSFKLADEMQTLFDDLDDRSGIILTLLDAKGDVIESSQPGKIPQGLRIHTKQAQQMMTINHQQYFVASARCRGYQGYKGLGWQGCVLMPLLAATNSVSSFESKTSDTDRWQGFSPALNSIQRRAKVVTEDLDLVVLNGRIAAARTEADEFIPILEEIRQIGQQMQGIFSRSVSELMSTALNTHLVELRRQAALAIDIMDRNLYERANDCRWWGLTPLFIDALTSNENFNLDMVTRLLAYINELYSVYTGIYLFDSNGKVIAVSSPALAEIVGTNLTPESGWQGVLNLNQPQQYCVSGFLPSTLYDEQLTYIYNAALFQHGNVIGGIGLVFDSQPQFQQMLVDVIAESVQRRMGLFVERSGRVVSCTPNAKWSVGETFPLPRSLTNLQTGEGGAEIVELEGQEYLIGYTLSKGYREYKNSDGYKNDVIALVLEANQPIRNE